MLTEPSKLPELGPLITKPVKRYFFIILVLAGSVVCYYGINRVIRQRTIIRSGVVQDICNLKYLGGLKNDQVCLKTKGPVQWHSTESGDSFSDMRILIFSGQVSERDFENFAVRNFDGWYRNGVKIKFEPRHFGLPTRNIRLKYGKKSSAAGGDFLGGSFIIAHDPKTGDFTGRVILTKGVPIDNTGKYTIIILIILSSIFILLLKPWHLWRFYKAKLFSRSLACPYCEWCFIPTWKAYLGRHLSREYTCPNCMSNCTFKFSRSASSFCHIVYLLKSIICLALLFIPFFCVLLWLVIPSDSLISKIYVIIILIDIIAFVPVMLFIDKYLERSFGKLERTKASSRKEKGHQWELSK